MTSKLPSCARRWSRKQKRKKVMEEDHDPDLTDHNNEMKEENEERGLSHSDQLDLGLKEEIQDPETMDYDHYKVEIKEEDQDPDFDDQDQYASEIKEEYQLPDYLGNDHYTVIITEQDQDPEQRSSEAAGPSSKQVSIWTGFISSPLLTGNNDQL